MLRTLTHRPLTPAAHSDAPVPAGPSSRASMGDVRAVYAAVLVTLVLAFYSMFVRLQIMAGDLARPRKGNIFFRLYAMHEQPFLAVLALTAVIAYVVLRTRPPLPAITPARDRTRQLRPTTRSIAVIAALVLVVTVGVAHLVMHGLPFSMDEFSADFQSKLFAAGEWRTTVPAAWRPYAGAIVPVFVQYRFDSATWFSMYLPVYALLKAPFVAAGASLLLNPLLAALSVLALGAVARRLWPNEVARPWLAVALLVTSSQFVVTSGTQYSMPAHLCLNLIWLWLYLRGDRWSWAAALVVGALALGLHTPFPHALFVAPFLVRLVRDRRWGRVASAAVAYGIAAALWLTWMRIAQPVASGGTGGLLSVFAFPTPRNLWLHSINLSLLFTWHTPVFGVLVLAAVIQARQLERTLRDLAWGVLLTLVFFTFFPASQGHGWGYRYAYQVVGSLALLGAAGLEPLLAVVGTRRTQILVVGSLFVTLALELPLRLLQTERFVRPFAAGVDYVTSRHAEVVVVHADSIWYGRDLQRNDPFLRGQPVVVGDEFLTPEGRAYLRQTHPGRVVDVTDAELIGLGMTRWRRRPGEY